MRKFTKLARPLLILFLLVALVLPLAPASPVQAAGWLGSWAYRVSITIDQNDITANLSNHPFLIYLSTSSGISNDDLSFVFDELTSDANRFKIAVTASDGTTQLYVEIEEWVDATEEAWLWVKAPAIASDADTVFYLYYDSLQANNTTYIGDPNSVAAENVWDSYYKFVSHMRDDPNNANVRDSTSYDNDGTKAAAADPTLNTSGPIGDAQDFDGTADYITITDVASLSAFTELSFEALFKSPTIEAFSTLASKVYWATAKEWVIAVAGSGASTDIYIYIYDFTNDSGMYVYASVNLFDNAQYHLMYTWDGGSAGTTNFKIYVNGVSQGLTFNLTGSFTSITDTGQDVLIGGFGNIDAREVTGTIDEVRISETTRSAAWAKASYEGSIDHLIEYGTGGGPAAPTVTTSAATSVEETTATLVGDITDTGGFDATNRGFEWDIDTGSPYANDWNENGTFGIAQFTRAITGLIKGELYYYRAYATNTEGTGNGNEVTFLTKPDEPTNLVAEPGDTLIDLTWDVGAGKDTTIIRGKIDSYPANYNTDVAVYNGVDALVTHTGLTNGVHWYYRAWSYTTEGGKEQWSDTYSQADATPAVPGAAPIMASIIVEGFGRDWVILRGQVTDDRGNTLDEIGFEYGITDSYGSDVTESGSWNDDDYFVLTITGLSPGSVYHWRAIGSYPASAEGAGDDMYVSTTGSLSMYEYLNTGGDGDAAHIYGDNWLAQQFTVGATSHTAETVRLYIKRTGSPGTVTVSIRHADDADKPTGIDLGEGTIGGDAISTSYTWYEVEIEAVSLEATEKYAVVVRAIAGDTSNDIQWRMDTGGSLADSVGMSSTNSGVSWSSDTPKDYLFEIWGTPTISIESAAVFEGYLEDNDLLFVIEYVNVYPPYFGDRESAPRYFDIRLYDTDGTTVIASTVCKDWGNKPAAIYLSADEAGPLTPGSQFYLKLRGSFTGNPVASYQLATDDWRGTNLAFLDDWVRLTAYSIEDYYSIKYTTPMKDRGIVLNEAGGLIFDNGINGLSVVRRDLFQVTSTSPINKNTEWTNAFQSGIVFETKMGSDIPDALTPMADLFGFSAQNLLGMILMLVIVGFGIFVLASGSVIPGLCILGIGGFSGGAVLGFIDIIPVALGIFLLAVVGVWGLIWSKT